MLEALGGIIGVIGFLWFAFGMIAPGKALPYGEPSRWIVGGLALLVMGIGGGIQSADPEFQAKKEAEAQAKTEASEAKAEERRIEKAAAAARKAEEERGHQWPTAYEMAQKFVIDRVKSPATAEFPSVLWDKSEIEWSYDEEEDTYIISSYVDSQNAFGATVRTNFIAKLQNTEGKNWKLLKLHTEAR